MWEVDESLILPWLDTQPEEVVIGVTAACAHLERFGPALGRPLVDRIHHASVHNLKELRPIVPGQHAIRILFAFDRNRTAVLLVAGDKAMGSSDTRWNRWYRKSIPIAERLLEERGREKGLHHER